MALGASGSLCLVLEHLAQGSLRCRAISAGTVSTV